MWRRQQVGGGIWGFMAALDLGLALVLHRSTIQLHTTTSVPTPGWWLGLLLATVVCAALTLALRLQIPLLFRRLVAALLAVEIGLMAAAFFASGEGKGLADGQPMLLGVCVIPMSFLSRYLWAPLAPKDADSSVLVPAARRTL